MTPDKCPACGAKLRRDMLACPNCPMSFPEDDGPRGSVNPLKQSPYYKFIFPVVFFSGLGALVWYSGSGLMRLGLANNSIETPSAFGDKPPAPEPAPAPSETSREAAAPASVEASTGDAPAAEDPGMVVISKLDENGTPIGPAVKSTSKGTKAKAPREWRLRGEVYDLTTLKPLAGCAVQFSDPATNRSIKTRTDSSGRYRAIVPPLTDGSGYSVAIEKSGYAPNYLNPGTAGVREMDARRRREMARDLAETLGAAPATVSSESEKPVVTDFYLAPRP